MLSTPWVVVNILEERVQERDKRVEWVKLNVARPPGTPGRLSRENNTDTSLFRHALWYMIALDCSKALSIHAYTVRTALQSECIQRWKLYRMYGSYTSLDLLATCDTNVQTWAWHRKCVYHFKHTIKVAQLVRGTSHAGLDEYHPHIDGESAMRQQHSALYCNHLTV